MCRSKFEEAASMTLVSECEEFAGWERVNQQCKDVNYQFVFYRISGCQYFECNTEFPQIFNSTGTIPTEG